MRKIDVTNRLIVQLEHSTNLKKIVVSRRMASIAKELRKSFGFGSYPEPKLGYALLLEIFEKVEQFYSSDVCSRVMTGRKDYIRIIKDGVNKKGEAAAII